MRNGVASPRNSDFCSNRAPSNASTMPVTYTTQSTGPCQRCGKKAGMSRL